MKINILDPYSVSGVLNKDQKTAMFAPKVVTITTLENAAEEGISKYRDDDKDGYVDLPANHKLSEFFNYGELIRSDNATKFNLENRVPISRTDILESAIYTGKNLLDKLRNQFGSFVPNSWYRGPEVEYAATYRDGFVKYISKSYSRTQTGEPTAAELVSTVTNTMFLRDLVSRANSGSRTCGLILNLWNNYYKGKQHPNGEAVDFEIAGSKSNKLLWDWIKASDLKYDQLILEFHKPQTGPFSGWVHGSVIDEQVKGRKNRMSAFTI